MTGLIRDELAGRRPELQKVAALLGGARVLGRSLKDPLDAHEVLLRGLPGKDLPLSRSPTRQRLFRRP